MILSHRHGEPLSLLETVSPRDRWERPALSEEAQSTWSYGQLFAESTSIAALFQGVGLAGGSLRIVGNHKQMMIASVLAATVVGASPYVQDPRMAWWSSEIANGPQTEHLAVCGTLREARSAELSSEEWMQTGQYRTLRLYSGRPLSSRPPSAPGIWVSTSGSSGAKKVVSLGLGAVIGNMRANALSLRLSGDSRTLVILPLHYSYGLLAQCGSTLCVGGHVVLTNASPESFLRLPELVCERKISDLFLVPALADPIARALTSRRRWSQAFSTLRLLTVGGAMVSETTINSLVRQLPAVELFVTYGLAEAGPRVTTLDVRKDGFIAGAIGKPISGVSVSIVDGGSDVFSGTGIGALCIQSQYVMDRYVMGEHQIGFIPRKQFITTDRGYLNEQGGVVLEGNINDPRGGKGCLTRSSGHDYG